MTFVMRRIALSQGTISPVSQNVAMDPVVAIHDAREIRIRFSNVLAYQVTKESYGFGEPNEGG